ncbi:hypothetical protein [Variovorax sp. HW608]|uniref:hypothetical protein n=1 Tax=Variovorax sp. HW608 TaxID=1034889 RepID=UPI0012FDEE6B|nr:hypothetical protein [Variovorax sp. HW608]
MKLTKSETHHLSLRKAADALSAFALIHQEVERQKSLLASKDTAVCWRRCRSASIRRRGGGFAGRVMCKR